MPEQLHYDLFIKCPCSGGNGRVWPVSSQGEKIQSIWRYNNITRSLWKVILLHRAVHPDTRLLKHTTYYSKGYSFFFFKMLILKLSRNYTKVVVVRRGEGIVALWNFTFKKILQTWGIPNPVTIIWWDPSHQIVLYNIQESCGKRQLQQQRETPTWSRDNGRIGSGERLWSTYQDKASIFESVHDEVI